MSIKDLKLLQTREDGKTYETTLGTREEDAKIQSEKLQKKRMRKLKWVSWRKKWVPIIVSGIEILAIVAVVGILLYYIFWFMVIFMALAACGSGMSEYGRESKERTDYYNQLRRDRPTKNPKYWRR